VFEARFRLPSSISIIPVNRCRLWDRWGKVKHQRPAAVARICDGGSHSAARLQVDDLDDVVTSRRAAQGVWLAHSRPIGGIGIWLEHSPSYPAPSLQTPVGRGSPYRGNAGSSKPLPRPAAREGLQLPTCVSRVSLRHVDECRLGWPARGWRPLTTMRRSGGRRLWRARRHPSIEGRGHPLVGRHPLYAPSHPCR
jgi:hypothetical protein